LWFTPVFNESVVESIPLWMIIASLGVYIIICPNIVSLLLRSIIITSLMGDIIIWPHVVTISLWLINHISYSIYIIMWTNIEYMFTVVSDYYLHSFIETYNHINQRSIYTIVIDYNFIDHCVCNHSIQRSSYTVVTYYDYISKCIYSHSFNVVLCRCEWS
jgi:hypothetical protein